MHHSEKRWFVHPAFFDIRPGRDGNVFYNTISKKPDFSEESVYSSQIIVDSAFDYLYYLPQTACFDRSNGWTRWKALLLPKECASPFMTMSSPLLVT
jgi:hypothetical protein